MQEAQRATGGAGQAGEKIRVFVVDDHPMLRNGVALALRHRPDVELVGEAGSGEEALRLVPPAAPDVVLMDLVLEGADGLDGIDTTERLLDRCPQTRFVILTSLIHPGEIDRAIRVGASGYILKTTSQQDLLDVIFAVQQGRRVMAPEALAALRAAAADPVLHGRVALTEREREVLMRLAQGMTNLGIAGDLNISASTVKFHLTNLLDKLGAGNRTEAVVKALDQSLIPRP